MGDKVKATYHGDQPVDVVLRAWAFDAADPLALLARMAEGEAPASIVQELTLLLQQAGCPTCSWPSRETVGMVCQTCGKDYGRPGANST
jgi:hypothetical protein